MRDSSWVVVTLHGYPPCLVAGAKGLQDRAGCIRVLGCGSLQKRGKCLTCLPRAGQLPVPGTKTSQQHMEHSRGVDQTVFEGIFRKQSLFCPGSSWQVRHSHIMKQSFLHTLPLMTGSYNRMHPPLPQGALSVQQGASLAGRQLIWQPVDYIGDTVYSNNIQTCKTKRQIKRNNPSISNKFFPPLCSPGPEPVC